jgi:hypothetical protein
MMVERGRGPQNGCWVAGHGRGRTATATLISIVTVRRWERRAVSSAWDDKQRKPEPEVDLGALHEVASAARAWDH